MPLSVRLFGTAKGRRANETNALTTPALITRPDRPPNRWASARANYAALPADRANRTVFCRESQRDVARFLRAHVADSPRLWSRNEIHPIDLIATVSFFLFSLWLTKERNFASKRSSTDQNRFRQRVHVRDFCKSWGRRGEFFLWEEFVFQRLKKKN